MTVVSSQRAQVDPRGPRFGAAITAVLLAANLILALLIPTSSLSLVERLAQPAFILLLVLFALFLYGAIRGVQKHPYGILFAKVIRPRLSAAAELEDAAAPTFAQGVGAFVTGAGLLLFVIGVPLALPIAIAAAFVAAFLNAAFGYCLGCEMYLLLRRAGVLKSA